MKKKLLSMMLCAVLVAGSTSGAMAAEKNICSNEKLQNLLQTHLTKYFDRWSDKLPGIPGVPQRPESGDTEEQDKPVQLPSQNEGSRISQVVSLVNAERAEAGLSSLSSDRELNRLAQLKAEDMAEKGYFSHTSSTYGSAFDMMQDAGYSYRTAGENIAKGQKTAEAVMNGWMNSSGHRANILSSGYTRIGVGYASDSNGTPYWVQIFAG